MPGSSSIGPLPPHPSSRGASRVHDLRLLGSARQSGGSHGHSGKQLARPSTRLRAIRGTILYTLYANDPLANDPEAGQPTNPGQVALEGDYLTTRPSNHPPPEGGNLTAPPSDPLPPRVTLCEYHGVEPRGYPLDPSRRWEADLEALDQRIDNQTSAILVCNPGNPTGSNYSREHLEAIVAIAERRRVPIIADESLVKNLINLPRRALGAKQYDCACHSAVQAQRSY
eukprot:1194816-Prorocentrum_minimum.AAC.1